MVDRSVRISVLALGVLLTLGLALAKPAPPNPSPPPVVPAPAEEAPAAPSADAAPAAPSPHIAFDKTELDLGDVIHGQDAVATFTYHNTGSVPLHILSAKPG